MIRLAAALLLVLLPAFGQGQGEDVATFARRVAGGVSTQSVRLSVVAIDRSPTDREWFTQALREALRERRISVSGEARTELRITLSSQTGEALWVAEILDAERRTAIVFRPSEPTAEGEDAPPTMALLAQPVFSQDEAILDLAERDGSLYVLSENSVSLFQGGPGQWQRIRRLALRAEPSRDARGKLRLLPESVEAYRPGLRCTGGLLLTEDLECASSAEWPLEANIARINPGGNAFSGELRFANALATLPPFYSIAFLGDAGGFPIAAALIDGSLGTMVGAGEPLRRSSGFGSQVAALKTACGGGTLLLTSGEGDAAQADFLRAARFNGQLTPVGSALEISGIVTELRTEHSRNRALAIVRERSTNRYVALYISAICGG